MEILFILKLFLLFKIPFPESIEKFKKFVNENKILFIGLNIIVKL